MPLTPWYRAQPLEDERWVYGWYFEIDNIPYIITRNGETYAVNITTLGLFTGHLDSYDLRVYEGDIVSDGSKLYQVLFDHEYAGFLFKDKKGNKYAFNDILIRGIRLYSNIYDEPYYMMG